jgi:hypothetical protein
MDLQAGFGLPEGLDPVEVAARLVSRYEDLWHELTREDVFGAEEQYRIDGRVQRLNALGFDVEELEVESIDAGHRIRMRAKVVEPGHHRRLLQGLTGLDVEENQARTLLNDLNRFRAWLAGLAGHPIAIEVTAYRWLNEVYRVTLDAIPAALRHKLDDAEIFHQILEHRWYMSERAARDMPLAMVVPSYVEQVLAHLPDSNLRV